MADEKHEGHETAHKWEQYDMARKPHFEEHTKGGTMHYNTLVTMTSTMVFLGTFCWMGWFNNEFRFFLLKQEAATAAALIWAKLNLGVFWFDLSAGLS